MKMVIMMLMMRILIWHDIVMVFIVVNINRNRTKTKVAVYGYSWLGRGGSSWDLYPPVARQGGGL